MLGLTAHLRKNEAERLGSRDDVEELGVVAPLSFLCDCGRTCNLLLVDVIRQTLRTYLARLRELTLFSVHRSAHFT
jgi:hypothetical protein